MVDLDSPLEILPVSEDFTIPATMFDPELTIYADGTDLMMVWDGGLKGRRVTAIGVTATGRPYRFQRVRYVSDGTEHNVAPHVLHKD